MTHIDRCPECGCLLVDWAGVHSPKCSRGRGRVVGNDHPLTPSPCRLSPFEGPSPSTVNGHLTAAEPLEGANPYQWTPEAEQRISDVIAYAVAAMPGELIEQSRELNRLAGLDESYMSIEHLADADLYQVRWVGRVIVTTTGEWIRTGVAGES